MYIFIIFKNKVPTEIETVNVITSNYVSSSYEGNLGIQPSVLLEYYNPISNEIDDPNQIEPSAIIEEEIRESNNNSSSSSSSHDNIFQKPPFLIQARPSHNNDNNHHRDIAIDEDNDGNDDGHAKLSPLQSKAVNIFPTRELMMSRVTIVKPEPDPNLEAEKTADSSPLPLPSISEPPVAATTTANERGLEGELVSLLGTVIQSQQTVNTFF